MRKGARHILGAIATGLMVLAVLVLSTAPVRLGTSGHAHSYAAHHHAGAGQAMPGAWLQAGAPCADHCGAKAHGPACCIAACALASASLPAGSGSATPPPDTIVSYRAAATGSLAGLAPDPALRPPERIG